MTKLLLSTLLLGTLALAEQKNYEISPMVAYDLHETSLGFKDDGYLLGGLEFQINNVDSQIKPEFSLFATQGVDYASGQDTKIIRAAFNGVYALQETGSFAPFVKAGLGMENVTNESTQNQGALFLDAGVGAKVNFTESLALKLEAMYLGKVAQHNTGIFDHNLIALVGFTYSFGETEQKSFPVQAEKVAPVVVAAPVVIDGDDDKDGILNSKDSCPSTIAGAKVDNKGCNVDIDGDGVLNAQDICPNTLAGDTVNSDGCPKTVPLKINFENNSDVIKSNSDTHIQAYADFLTNHTNYSSKIIGYTDSKGSATYNKALSKRRANAVVSALVAKGVNVKQLSAQGLGEAEPVADNKTPEGRAQNRRIDTELTRN